MIIIKWSWQDDQLIMIIQYRVTHRSSLQRNMAPGLDWRWVVSPWKNHHHHPHITIIIITTILTSRLSLSPPSSHNYHHGHHHQGASQLSNSWPWYNRQPRKRPQRDGEWWHFLHFQTDSESTIKTIGQPSNSFREQPTMAIETYTMQ